MLCGFLPFIENSLMIQIPDSCTLKQISQNVVCSIESA